jgi:hypothetical protein
MYRIVLVDLLALTVQLHAAGHAQNSISDTPVDRLSDALLNHVQAVQQQRFGDLDTTTYGKVGNSRSLVPSYPCFTGPKATATPQRSMSLRNVHCLAVRLRQNEEAPVATPVSPDKPTNDDFLMERLRKDRKEIMRSTGVKQSQSGKRVVLQTHKGSDHFEGADFFEGAKTLLREGAWWSNLDLDQVGPGQNVVAVEDVPSAQLVKGQAYEVVRVYYQRLDDPLGQDRIAVTKFGAPPPVASSKKEVWRQWCDLYSKEYHYSPVRCQVREVRLCSVGSEVTNALKTALPMAVLPNAALVAYGALTQGGLHCVMGAFTGHCEV